MISDESDKESNDISRNGKWTEEEEKYAEKMIQMFAMGQLCEEDDDARNQSLRRYLAKKLNCHPMRLTKKFGGRYSFTGRYHRSSALCPSYDSDRQSLVCLQKEFKKKDNLVQNNRLKRRKYSHRYYVPKCTRHKEISSIENIRFDLFQPIKNTDTSLCDNFAAINEIGCKLPLNWEVDKLIDNSIDLIDFPMNLEP